MLSWDPTTQYHARPVLMIGSTETIRLYVDEKMELSAIQNRLLRRPRFLNDVSYEADFDAPCRTDCAGIRHRTFKSKLKGLIGHQIPHRIWSLSAVAFFCVVHHCYPRFKPSQLNTTQQTSHSTSEQLSPPCYLSSVIYGMLPTYA